ncbi:MAG: hypothetical protein QOJ15_3188, partial [Bradyrhizobium sp.]|nr:hypothetical protein [Bradyrhizobium sp.]
MSNLQPSRRGRRPSVVVVATVHWASTTRLCLSLAESGFEVVALAPDGHALHTLSGIVVRSIGRTRAHGLSEIIRTVESRPPDLLVPADERAIDFMRILYRRAIGGKGRNAGQMAALIEASLGSPSAFVFAAQKSRLVSLAQREGLLVPATNVVDDILELRRLVAKAQFPLVLKQDGSSGGQGVRIVSNAADAEQSFVELRRSAGPRAAVKMALKKLDLSYLDGLYRKRPAISLQEYIVGRPANRAVVCHRGEVLAGLSVEALQTTDACACRILHPAVLMMKSAENRPRGDVTELLNGPTVRRILLQRQMRSVFVVITDVGTKNSTQVDVAEDDDVIEAFPADRANQPLRMP